MADLERLTSTAAGSLLVSGLAQSFKKIVQLEVERDSIREEKDKKLKEKAKKKNTKGGKPGDKDEKKVKSEIVERQVVREGNNSFITLPTASSFAVFSHIRHLVLQQQLCDTYNFRNRDISGELDSDDSDGDDDNNNDGKNSVQKLPEVVTIGIRGVFAILQDVWQTVPELCVKVLGEFLNILQGQNPAGLKNESSKTTTALFDLLVKMVSQPVDSKGDSEVTFELINLASSCLLSLVIALGETDKLLAAISALLLVHQDVSNSFIKIPTILRSLQATIQATLMGSLTETDWIQKGVLQTSLTDSWPLGQPVSDGSDVAIATDSSYLYAHGPFGLLKVGLGYGSTTKGHVYETVSDFHNTESGRLMLVMGSLFYCSYDDNKIIVIDPLTLKIDKEMELEGGSVGPMCLFSDGKDLQQIIANKEGGFSLCKLTTICSPIPVVDKIPLDLMQKSLLCIGKSRYNPQSNHHTIYQNNSLETQCVIASKTFSAVLTSCGQLFYQGNGSMFGITEKDVPKSEWKQITLPDPKVTISQIKGDHTGCYCLAISNQGVVYFGGTNRKGEAAENPPAGRQSSNPIPFKKITKMKEKTIIGCACGTLLSGIIDKEGKLYLFGVIDSDDLVDKQTGAVTDLLGVPVTNVAMGRSHICVLTQMGTVYTFGNNQFGQCGRNYIPPEEGLGFDADAEEGSDSDDSDDDDLCAPGDHDWSTSRCMVCKICKYCTGYGPTCCNDGIPGREPGNDCGCGSGDSGCSNCGACKVCVGETESWGGGTTFYDIENEEPEIFELIVHARNQKDKKEKEKEEGGDKKKKKDKKKEKEVGEMGLQLLFGGKDSIDKEDDKSESEDVSKIPDDKLSTKKPGLLLLPNDNTVMQIDCGMTHTVVLLRNGEVYGFGNNSNGQIGQGNTKLCGHPVKVPLPGPAQQIACGESHTVVLLATGEVYTFGKHQEGQLGRQPTGLDNEFWYANPDKIDIPNEGLKVKWISATGHQTFVSINESLIAVTSLSRCRVFANSQCIGIVSPPTTDRPKCNLIMIDSVSSTAKKIYGDDQVDLTDSALCVNPEYSMLWAYNVNNGILSCYNPISSEVKDTTGTILVPPLCLPLSKDAVITRRHGALNLLSCLHTSTTHPPLSMVALTGRIMKIFNPEDFKSVNRFSSTSPGWGYNPDSVEAIKFSCDQDVLLGGFGLYSGSAKFNASIKVYSLESADVELTTNQIASGEEKGFSSFKTKTHRVILDKPVIISAEKWYMVLVKMSSDSLASSGAGSSGMQQVTGSDKVVFKFKGTKLSNNGTDMSSGQIPEILYRSPEFEQESGVSIQVLDKKFSSNVTYNGLQAVQSILGWSWDCYIRQPDNDEIRMIVKNSLGILSAHIKEIYPSKGINRKALPDSQELAEAVHNAVGLIKSIFSCTRPQLEDSSLLEKWNDIMKQCRETFTSCFHAFFPSSTLKWFALCHMLQSIDPSDIIVGFPGDNLLSAVLEALSSPDYSYVGLSYDTSFNLVTALGNVSDNSRFPVLTKFMHMKTKEEFGQDGELMSFQAISSKLLSLISASLRMELSGETVPCANVVNNAGEFLVSRFNELALCSSYQNIANYSGLTVVPNKKRDSLWETSVRFPSRDVGYPELTSTDVTFSTNKPVSIRGFGVFGDNDVTYDYTISILKDGATMVKADGSFSPSDCTGDDKVATLMFPSPCKLEQNVIYIARVSLKGKHYTVGTEGKQSVIGQGGVVITFHSTGLVESNQNTGPLAKFHCSSLVSTPRTVVQLSVHMASMLLDLTVGFLTRILSAGPTQEALQALSSSYLMSKLLPNILAQLGTIASQQPESSVGVLEMIRRTLPVITAAVKGFRQLTNPDICNSDTEYLDSKLLHYANIETDHPYKQATVSHYRVKFPDQVKWLSLEFDSKCGFAQPEDKLINILVPRITDNTKKKDSSEDSAVVTPMIGIDFEDLYSNFQNFGLSTLAGLLILPGNEIHIVIGTDTEYEKKEKNNHFGVKCKVIGYEWSHDIQQCLSLLEKELVTLGAMCSGALLIEHLNLPFAEELPVSNGGDEEKADMRIVQAAAQDVLSKHCQLLGSGLYADPPSVSSALKGEVSSIVNSPEQQFLHDFIKSKTDSPGGRLARWLQPDRSVDPDASVINITTPTDDMQVGKKIECTVCTKDQNGKTVFVNGMSVEVKCEWQGQSMEESTSIDDGVDSIMGVRRPTYKRPFITTSLGSNNVYQTIPMMMPYSDYSFEELRFYSPKVIGSIESMNVTSNSDGTYSVNWVPSTSGTYNVRICIDGSLSGDGETIVVIPKETPLSVSLEEKPSDTTEDTEETKVIVEVIKKKRFPKGKAPGLRIRSEPSLKAGSVGLINPGDEFIYTEEIENESGKWAKLSPLALEQFKCTKPAGYTLAYSKERNLTVLEEIEPEEIKHVIGGTVSYKKRKGGPGTYTVVHCGAAGHNIRTSPGMKGIPVGRLAKGSSVEIKEELENDDGIWLRLSPSSGKKLCDSDEAWTLVVHPSGRIFLSKQDDDSYKAFEPQPSTMQASFPSAASVFGTQDSTSTSAASIFGFNPVGLPPPAVPSFFGTSKPDAGKIPTPPPLPSIGCQSILKVKLTFGENGGKGDKPPAVFQFSSKPSTDGEKEDKKYNKDGSLFSVGVSDTEKSPRRRPPTNKDSDKITPSGGTSSILSSSQTNISALSPAVAECQRAIFAAFLWQENLVHDAMAAAFHLKLHPSITKEMRLDIANKDKKISHSSKIEDNECEEAGVGDIVDESLTLPNLPPTINHLVTFWDEIAVKVIENSSMPFVQPKVPSLMQELQRLYDEEKKEMEKLKKEKSNKPGGGGGGGTTICELCDQPFPDPVTYHMKEAHPGCRKHASGWGYNSRGSFCSGWAGNCGDGGRGGSTWYLMCKDCHAKYLQNKEESKKKAPKQIVLPKMKCRKPGKPRELPVLSAIQGMIQNAKFLIDISCEGENVSKSKVTTPNVSRKTSTPDDVKDKTSSMPRKQQLLAQEAPLPFKTKHPVPFLRSISVAAGGIPEPIKRIHSDSSEEILEAPPLLSRQKTEGPSTDTTESSGLVMKPSMSLAKLMYQRSRKGIDCKDSGYSRVLNFVQRYHDLDGLRVSMKQAMRIAVLRSFALEFLEWLLIKVSVPSVVHDVLWHFMAAISNHPMITAANQTKEETGEDGEDQQDWSLGKHPLTGLEGAGSSLVMLRKKFHSLLQTIANIMSKLPVGSSAQQMALKCWCLEFQPQDQSFLLHSRVFANISETLSSMEETEGSKQRDNNSKTSVDLMDNIITTGKLKTSSNEAMSISLTDSSTETFWESKDEARSKTRSITVTFNDPTKVFAGCIHIDNQKDAGQRVDQVSILAGSDEACLKESDKCILQSSHAGWKVLIVPPGEDYGVVKFELKGSSNNVRVRQVIILGVPNKPLAGACLKTEVAMLKDCEAEALRLFRLLTSQVFGGLLNQPIKEGEDETDSGGEEGTDAEPSSMANILFNNKSSLSGLQRSVCQHVMDSVHSEAEKMKIEWEASIKESQSLSSKPAVTNRQTSHDPGLEGKTKGGATDTYCYELLTMLSGLSQNELGCTFLAEHSQLVKDLVSLLHTASSRIQLKICNLLRLILPYIKPKDFAGMCGVTVLPPLGYSAIAEAVNSAATINQLGLLDCFLAIISKALSVQVKVKGRGSNILQALTGKSAVTAVTLACLKDPKTVAGEATVKSQRWYLNGTVGQDVAAEVMHLLREMTKGSLKGQWKDYAKSAIGQAVLHVTKIAEEARNADPGMYSHTLWLCLAALCVIDEEHADALSSGQWLGQDGLPQHKPLCDNHDDGETKALILCDDCGNLCGECDRVLHYHRKRSSHQRQVFKEEEEAVKVDLHEGCGRIKLYWTMALADSRTLKGMVEFKDTIGGGGKGACRFCGSASTPSLLAIGNVCSDPECQDRAKTVCEKTLSCGHHCCGVKGEEKCLPCLHGCGEKEGATVDHPPLKQDADDMCMICYTEGLSCAPCIQLECGHVFHYHCCHNALTKKWSGPRITFRFMFCSICEKKNISHPHLMDIASPLFDLYEDVKRKCLLRLEYENQSKCEAVTSSSSKFYQKPQEYALWKYAYYVCYKCKKAYYGGEAHCAEAASDEFDPTELVCPSCSHTGGGQMQICPKHGTDFLEYKCRYCCSVAVYFCFGTTHFCNPCHDDFQRVTSIPKSEFPMCPVGPRSKPLSGTECPLHVKHPPTGEEFALGCGVCRNAQTF